ncbi:MAG: hypothetical protein P8X74_07310 [Reinekea sp.]|jgi:hypothetical protein
MKKVVFQRIVWPTTVVLAFVISMGIAIDEYVAAQGGYRITLWDHITGHGDVPQGRAEVSQQVAIEVCRQRALSEFGRNLLLSKFDQRSSRYNNDLKVHTIFVNLTIKSKERDPIYIRCDISAVNRMILESRIKGLSGFSFFGK